MNFRHNFMKIVPISLATALLLSACSSASQSYDSYAEKGVMPASSMAVTSSSAESMETSQILMHSEGENTAGKMAALSERKIIKHSNMDLETESFEQALSQIRAMIEEQGGYIESESIGGRSLMYKGEYFARSASLTARIPAEKLDVVTAGVSGVCNVLSRSENVDDITDSYFDSQARLESLKLQEERLLDILSKAEKLEEVITLEQALSNARYEIESLTAILKRMDSKVQYSYLNMNLQEVASYTETKHAPRSFGEEVSISVQRSLKRVSNSAKATVLGFIESAPVFLLNLFIFAVVAWILIMVAKLVLRCAGIKNRFTVRKKKEIKQVEEIIATSSEEDAQE